MSTTKKPSHTIKPLQPLPAFHEPSTSTSSSPPPPPKPKKQLVLIRHGCTHMNEYLNTPGSNWGDPHFTDIFPTPAEQKLYHDSPLSTLGIQQAMSLRTNLSSLLLVSSSDTNENNEEEEGGGGTEQRKAMLSPVELVVVSPLLRTLQTYDIGVRPVLEQQKHEAPPLVVAQPSASERVYLVSDLGKPVRELSRLYPSIDFVQGFAHEEVGGSKDGTADNSGWRGYDPDQWWYHPKDNTSPQEQQQQQEQEQQQQHQPEWRPNDAFQTYGCPGEPPSAFEERMKRLYEWLDKREERMIVVVCHWGVLEWLTGVQFENCEVKVVAFEDLVCGGKVRAGCNHGIGRE